MSFTFIAFLEDYPRSWIVETGPWMVLDLSAWSNYGMCQVYVKYQMNIS